MNWIDELTPEQRARWTDVLREPFRLFKTTEEELATPSEYWRTRTPDERMEYLEHTRCVIYGKEIVNAKLVRCYGWRKVGEQPDPKNIVYF